MIRIDEPEVGAAKDTQMTMVTGLLKILKVEPFTPFAYTFAQRTRRDMLAICRHRPDGKKRRTVVK